MRNLTLAFVALSFASIAGCQAVKDQLTVQPDGTVPAAQTFDKAAAAVSTVNPAAGAAIGAVGLLIGSIFGRKTAPTVTVAADPKAPTTPVA